MKKQKMRFISAVLAACMMTSVLPVKKRQQELLRERELSIILQNMSVALRIERQQYEFMERNA